MNQVGFAPAVSLNAVRITIAALIAAAAFAVGMFSPASATADGSVDNCSSNGVNVGCVGQVGGVPLTINIGDVGTVTNNQLAILSVALSQVLQNFANVSNILVQTQVVNTVTSTVSTWTTTIANTTTKACSIIVPPPATGGGNFVIGCS